MSDGNNGDSQINGSQFHMWRALFAVVHADGVVSDEEVRFMAEVMEDIPFSSKQKSVLLGDVAEAQDVEKMYAGITDPVDQAEFFDVARKLVHIDGDYSEEEREVMLKLKELHVRETNVDHLIGRVNLQLEDDDSSQAFFAKPEQAQKEEGFKDALYSFRDHFMKTLRSR